MDELILRKARAVLPPSLNAPLEITGLVEADLIGRSVACSHGRVNGSTNESTHMVDADSADGVDERDSA